MAVAKYAVEYKNDGFIFLALSPGVVDTQNATGPRTSLLKIPDPNQIIIT